VLPDAVDEIIKDHLTRMNKCWPAIVESFDSVNQTVSVQVALKRLNGKPISIVVDCPISIPTCQGFHLTLPIKKGDECLLIIADRCIDNWFSKGGLQTQAEFRIHDISDGFALIGINSKPNKISSYNANDAEFRNDAGTTYIRLKANGDVEIATPGLVKVDCDVAEVNADTSVDVTAPDITLTGAVHVVGALDATGLLSSATGVSGPAIDLETHTHTYTPGAGAPTETSDGN